MPPEIAENGEVTVSGLIEDPGSLDTHTVELTWGDGTTETLVIDPATRTFSATHQYLDDDPTGTPADDYTITATVTDDDGGVGTTSTTVTVENIEPAFAELTLTRSTAGDGLTVTLDGSVVDVGSLDTHTIVIDWGDGTTETLPLPADPTDFGRSHTYAQLGIYEVTVNAIDDDTGIGDTAVDAVLSGVRLVEGVLQIVGTNGDDTVAIRRPLDPIAYYNFDETSGTLVADQAGTPQNGTVFTGNNQSPPAQRARG